MTKYYFFKVCREVNAQGECRTVVHALPGQFTYVNLHERNAAIDPAFKVQFTSAETHKIVQLSTGDIIGVKHVGVPRQAKLNIYTRNDQQFYRTEAEVFTVVSVFSHVGWIRDADDEMQQAYSHYVASLENNGTASSENDNEASPAPQAEQPDPLPDPNGDADEVRAQAETRIDSRRLSSIEDHLMDNMGEFEALGKLLIISQIRDRMRYGVVKFTFMKQNGDVRIAYGTLNQDVISMFQPAGNNHSSSGNTTADGGHFGYFDVQKRDWRCFCVEDIISFDHNTLIRNKDDIRTLSTQAA